MRDIAARIVERLLEDVSENEMRKRLVDVFRSIGKPFELADFEGIDSRRIAILYGFYVKRSRTNYLAAEFGVSTQRISQIVKRTVDRIRRNAHLHDIADVGHDIADVGYEDAYPQFTADDERLGIL